MQRFDKKDVDDIMRAVAHALVVSRQNKTKEQFGVTVDKWEDHLLNLARYKWDLTV